MVPQSLADERRIFIRPGLGLSSGIVQKRELRFARLTIDQPTLIVVRRGSKVLQSTGGQWLATPGQMIAIAGGQTFDVTNRPSSSGDYRAHCLVWDQAFLTEQNSIGADLPPLAQACVAGPMSAEFLAAFERAVAAIDDADHIPETVARHRGAEILLWLAQYRIRLVASDTAPLAVRVRRLVSTAADAPWTTKSLAARLGLSEATLRRRLAAAGTSPGEILVDTRMEIGLSLLQSTDFTINRIALEVGYDSPSRFAIRFRQRFGFAPSAVRGHYRAR